MNLANENNKNGLLYVAFNQDSGCFACGTDKGFTIYNCDPLKERFSREFSEGNSKGKGSGIGIVEMLFRCNILALVGGGKNPLYPPNKVLIWDDYQNKGIAELDFKSDVRQVKLRRDRIVVALETKVYVYNFTDLTLIDSFDTMQNPKGLCALSAGSNPVLAILGKNVGQVRIKLFDSNVVHDIQAHDNKISQIALNAEGSLLATCSEKGTLVRLYDTTTANLLGEFRRGALSAEIYNISFDQTSTWVCVTSDKGTVHIYNISGVVPGNPNSQTDPSAENRTSSLSFMKNILPTYFSSIWSCGQFTVPESRCICSFGQGNSIIVVCADGKYYKYLFDPVKKEAIQEDSAVLFKEEK
eukprot:TRINITY_DN12817_c0_g1_i1.p1 TRINITY_DN12817_c0_g1~~TRINITY_DN12817_c0_g1_i1.p1  ORF type:complete len:389 (+),score=130.02 TRINITY_DN12817_c0_g1_i1:100-1167(+)